MTKRVIKNANLPARLPVGSTIAVGLLLDRLHAHEWVWGAVGLLFAIMWIGSIYQMATEVQTDVFQKYGELTK